MKLLMVLDSGCIFGVQHFSSTPSTLSGMPIFAILSADAQWDTICTAEHIMAQTKARTTKRRIWSPRYAMALISMDARWYARHRQPADKRPSPQARIFGDTAT